ITSGCPARANACLYANGKPPLELQCNRAASWAESPRRRSEGGTNRRNTNNRSECDIPTHIRCPNQRKIILRNGQRHLAHHDLPMRKFLPFLVVFATAFAALSAPSPNPTRYTTPSPPPSASPNSTTTFNTTSTTHS